MMMCLTSDRNIMIPHTRRLMGLELTCSLTPSEVDDSSQGPFLSGQKIKAVFIFLGQSLSRTFSSGHAPYSPSYDMHLAYNERTMKTLDYLPRCHESLVQTRFSRIESAFDLRV